MPLATGTRIGPYEITGWLGVGGMGEVYRARDPRLGREVAIKLLSERLASDASRLLRFEQEARAVGQINHPNILSVFDVSRDAGTPFVVSELLEGETLGARLRRSRLPPRQVCEYVRQLADGLAAAHDKGVIHRDIKPENVFITNDGRIKILDFGIAKLTAPDDSRASSDDDRETEPSVVMGTTGYMSPEQVRGESVDRRSDIFAVGAIVYEMLTGRPAFARESKAETMAAILKEDPAALGVEIPAALAAIVSRCLEKRREARFQSARDLAFALGQLQAAVGPSSGLSKGRRRVLAGAAVVTALAFAFSAASFLPDRRRSIEDRFADATFTRFTNWEGTEGHAAISADGRFVAFIADRDGPFDLWVSQIGTWRFQNLTKGNAPIPPPGPPLRILTFSGDGSEIWLGPSGLVPLTGGAPRVFLPRSGTGPAWSPDGQQLAFFRTERNNPELDGDPLFVADHTGANARMIFHRAERDLHTHNPVWAPDGMWVYFVHGRSTGSSFEMDLWRVRPSGESPEQLTQLKTALDFFAPIDDRTVLYVAPAADGSGPWLWALDIPSRRTRRLVSGLEQYRTISASRDGRRIVATVADRVPSLAAVPILDRIADERDISPYQALAAPARMPRFGRRSLFYISAHTAVGGLWRLQSGEPVEIWRGADGQVVFPPAISRDESRLAVVLRRGDAVQLWVMSSDGSDARVLHPSFEPQGTGDWSPDGGWVVIGGRHAGKPGLYKLPVGDGAPVRLAEGAAVNPVWSPHGDLIVYNGPIVEGLASLRAITPEGQTVRIPEVEVRPGGQRFMPDGSGVVYQSNVMNFHVLDLATGTTRQLTRHDLNAPRMTGRTFDVSPDGAQIVFDRSKEESDVVLIELAR